MSGTLKGKFRPKHPEKYKGDAGNIVYRSSWERIFCNWCDNNDDIINEIVNRFKRLNVNPRLTSNFQGTGWPGTRTEDYTIMEQGFDPKKGQSSRHEFHNSGHPNSDNSISFSRSIDKTTTDGRVTENIMEAQSDVHRGSTSYQSPEDIAGIDILENLNTKKFLLYLPTVKEELQK